MKVKFEFTEKDGIEIETDINDPLIFSAFISSMMHEIKSFIENAYQIDDDISKPCMISIKCAANLACAGLDDESDIEQFINHAIERRVKNDTKGAADVSL